MSKELSQNTNLAHYRILSSIGKGGMGEVFLAQDTKLDRQVAIKVLPPEFAEDADRMSRFVREARSASALNHPNIITIYEIGESEGTHFIATEFIDGKTLNDYTKANPLDYKAALEIAIQVASALDEAHTAGIVHRDIKPDNVMIRANGLAKILDFGIAKLTEANTPSVTGGEAATVIDSGTMPGMIIGTPKYMSPEQAKGQTVDSRTDIFSFGVVLYEMLAGHLPFAGESAMEMIGAILKDEPKSLPSDVPSEITKIINQCLRKDRTERYQTTKDLLIDLKDVKQDLEFQDKLERSVVPHRDENKTQILQAATLDETNRTTTNQTVASHPTKKYLAIALAVLLVSAIGFFGYRSFAPNKQIESIAVLPFENKSADADTEYLSDGLAESLIYRLSQLPNLKVSPTSSVFRYKGKATDPQTVAKELGVDSVLTGRITQRGDSLTISVNLVDTRNGKSLWGEQYERKLSELLATQREIAAEITNKLQLKLSGAGEKVMTKQYTDNNDAYQLYLKGNFYASQYTKESLAKGSEYYNQAIAIDPIYALAYNGLAYYYIVADDFYLSPSDSMPKARVAAKRSLEIDETLADAHTSLAVVLHWYDWDWAAAEREYQRAIELNPNDPRTRQDYAWFLVQVGRTEQAIAEGKKAQQLDPLSPEVGVFLGQVLNFARRNEEAIEQLRKTVELDSNYWVAHDDLGRAYEQKGDLSQAMTEYQRARQLEKNVPEVLALVGRAYALSGKKAEAQKVIDELKELSKRTYVPPYNFAIIYAGLGNKDEAFARLNSAYDERSQYLTWLKVDSQMDNLRDDPRYKDLLKRMNLPE